MLKTLTLSLSLAVAFGLCSVSKAGHAHDGNAGCSTCGIASPQGGPVVSPQGVFASPQGDCGPTCVGECGGGKKKCSLFSGLGHKMNSGYHGLCKKLKPKPKCYTYEWVLKKKRVKNHGCGGSGCSSPTCETCSVYPSAQGGVASPQGYGSPQGYSSPQAGYGSPQAGYGSPQAGYGSPQAGYGTPQSGYSYGSGQIATTAPVGGLTSAPAAAPAGDEAPPAPEVAAPAPTSAPSTPAPATPAPVPPAPPAPPAPAPPGAQSSLLFSTPSGN